MTANADAAQRQASAAGVLFRKDKPHIDRVVLSFHRTADALSTAA